MKERKIKKRNKLATILTFVIVLIFANIFIYAREKDKEIREFFTGSSFGDLFGNIISGDFISIIFVIQIILVLAMGVLLYIGFFYGWGKKGRKRRRNKKKKSIKIEKGKGETDLDAFHRVLKKERELNVRQVSEALKVGEDKVLEWGRILEKNGLAITEYPTFSKPIIKCKDKVKKE